MAASARPILFASGPVPWLKPGVTVGSLLPLAVLGWRAAQGTLGANPIATVLNQLGLLALVMLVACLSCTPVRLLSGQTWPIRIRKTLGLLAFFYASLHFSTYLVLDQELSLSRIGADIAKRLFILVGLTAWLILIPLAVTSTTNMVRRLGHARWTRLHRLAYVTGTLGAVHFLMRVKKDLTEPAIYGVLLTVGFGIRLVDRVRSRRRRN